jgi:hypothetical protein
VVIATCGLLLPSAGTAAWRDWTVVATVRGETGSLIVRGTGARAVEPHAPGWIRRTDHQPGSVRP